MSRDDYLFNSTDFHSVDQNQRQKMRDEIKGINPDKLLNTSTDDLVQYFVEKYQVTVPELDIDNLVVDQQEKQIDVSHDRFRFASDRPGPLYVTGSEVIVEIPFSGEEEASKIRPNPFTLSYPRASVHRGVLTFRISGTNLTAERVRSEIDNTIAEIQSALKNLRANFSGLNSLLPTEAHSTIQARKDKLLTNHDLVASLGFKMKERVNALKTYAAPEVRRKISPVMPLASSEPFKPEPILVADDYEHVLSVLQNMVQVMEFSPSAFETLDEEALRFHFLVQLNGHYEGQATGETFNYEGKTDILIRSEGKNVFIAECKFWSGPKKLTETIDQLLGYSSWRDTKTAIVIFNKNRNFSHVLAAIPGTMRAHPQYKRELPGSTESVLRYQFANRDDQNREIFLTVLAFDVPTQRT